MSGLLFELDERPQEPRVRIVVVGVGGAGGNAVDRMIRAQVGGVEFVVVNTDAQALGQNTAPVRVQIGKTLTRGLGTGARPELARDAVHEDADELRALLAGASLVFVTAGMGGGTGTGAAPEVARLAREAGALTVGVVTRPFHFEMRPRMRRAEEGIAAMREQTDTLIVVSNQRLMSIVDQHLGLRDAFNVADEVLLSAVRGISDLITVPGLMNLDFADVREVMKVPGEALMGVGMAELGAGAYGAHLAAEQAISSPLLDEYSVHGAQRLLVNITGGETMSLMDVNDAMQTIAEAVGEDAEIFLGAVTDPALADRICVTVIATGLDPAARREEESSPARALPARPLAASTVRPPRPAVAAENRPGAPLLISWEPSETEHLSVQHLTPARAAQEAEPAEGSRHVPFRPASREPAPAQPQEDLNTPAFLRRTMD
ncbi:MAG: cell division protein FtsZ [bacterium]|jgi:cell division protein FtsZ|nr:cell division protein FtsZ [bacterium]